MSEPRRLRSQAREGREERRKEAEGSRWARRLVSLVSVEMPERGQWERREGGMTDRRKRGGADGLARESARGGRSRLSRRGSGRERRGRAELT